MSQKSSPKRRIFFALWPAPPLRDELKSLLWPVLSEQVKQTTAKRVPVHNWHITLAFVGNVSPQTVDDMQQQVDAMEPSPAFNLKLDTFGYWKRPKVAWLGCATVPPVLQALVTSLNAALEPCSYTPDHPVFAPHMTLLRKAQRGIHCDLPVVINWQVNEFVLVESTMTSNGSQYDVIHRWPLG